MIVRFADCVEDAVMDGVPWEKLLVRSFDTLVVEVELKDSESLVTSRECVSLNASVNVSTVDETVDDCERNGLAVPLIDKLPLLLECVFSVSETSAEMVLEYRLEVVTDNQCVLVALKLRVPPLNVAVTVSVFISSDLVAENVSVEVTDTLNVSVAPDWVTSPVEEFRNLVSVSPLSVTEKVLVCVNVSVTTELDCSTDGDLDKVIVSILCEPSLERLSE